MFVFVVFIYMNKNRIYQGKELISIRQSSIIFSSAYETDLFKFSNSNNITVN